MADVVKIIDGSDLDTIVEKIKWRQTHFSEDINMSVGVVLMNYGDKHVEVRCIHQEWSGTKGDLEARNGVPLCPNGHPLLEITDAPKLALIRMESNRG